MSLSLAQKNAWSLAKSLMVCITLFKADMGYGVMPSTEFDGEARMRWRIVVAAQQLLEGHELANPGRHRIKQKEERSVLQLGELHLLVDDELADFLERREGSVDAIVATFPSGQDAAVAQAEVHFACHAALAILRAHGYTDERQI